MAILNFPNSPQTGDQYTGDNGTTYVFDGVKWLSILAAGGSTNSIVNNGHSVQVDSTGNLILPAYTLPDTTGTTGQVLVWPGSGSTLVWSNQSGSGSSSSLVNGSATLTLNSDGSLTLPNGAKLDSGTPYKFATDNSVTQYIDLRDSSGRGFYTDSSGYTLRSNGDHNWIFGIDGSLTLPDSSVILGGQWSNNNSGVSLLTHDTDFNVYGQVSSSVSGTAYIYSGNNDGTRNLTVKTDSLNNVITIVNNSETWTFGTDGSLTSPSKITWPTNYAIDGSNATLGISMTTDRGTILFGNHPELGGPTHFHIMKQNPEAVDLIFGDDLNNVTMLAGSGGGISIQTQGYFSGGSNYWTFDSTGAITFPDTTVQTTAYRGTIIPASATPPSDPINGALWWDDAEGNLYINYSGIWVPATTTAPAPPSSVNDSYTPAVPGNWSGAAPTSIAEALDRVAAAIKALNSVGL